MFHINMLIYIIIGIIIVFLIYINSKIDTLSEHFSPSIINNGNVIDVVEKHLDNVVIASPPIIKRYISSPYAAPFNGASMEDNNLLKVSLPLTSRIISSI